MEETGVPKQEEAVQEEAKPEQAAQEKTETDQAAREEAESEQPLEDFPIPPATFEFLVISLQSQAEMQLGLLHFGEEKDRPKPNLRLARHTIDLMAMLAEKTKGNLGLDEQRLLENALTELRFRFVQVSESSAKR